MRTSHQQKSNTDTGYVADGRWEFDVEVARVFDDMLERSIPQYETMRAAVFEVASRFVVDKTWIMDLGTSRGEALAPLWSRYGAQCKYLGLEVSGPMLEAASDRFAGAIDAAQMEIRKHDFCVDELPVRPASVVQAVLCFCFVPLEHRQRLYDAAYGTLTPGGALVVVEKVLSPYTAIFDVQTEIYHEKKHRSGYSHDDIERKRLSLSGVLVPDSPKQIEARCHHAGFGAVDCFWRWMNFAAWVAVK